MPEVGVECHVDLAGVGSNLRDHPLNILLYKTKVNLQPDIRTLVLSFFRDEELLRSEEASLHLPAEKRLYLGLTIGTYEVASAFNFLQALQFPEPNVALFSFGMTPQSAGTVRLASSRPLDPPYVTLNSTPTLTIGKMLSLQYTCCLTSWRRASAG